ncbi:hypothetical protein [Paraburkholderia sp. Cpub6]|uniref:hypothetical protein n=1 Tax=Paraburkholderia sp. Cpub6 TaxID=2723094 RepID=UPI00181DA3C3|nr:hypothetical protein [Paraburkholderia sp. Cpub6]MBB5460163.1 hypothetical protein [Paraburkholderia sp. Cpub6]
MLFVSSSDTSAEQHLHSKAQGICSPHDMQRTYRYKGFEVSVDLEPVWESTGSAVPSLPIGFVANVSIAGKGMPNSLTLPIRVTNDNKKLFGTEAAALMAGFSAAQRLIDQTCLSD